MTIVRPAFGLVLLSVLIWIAGPQDLLDRLHALAPGFLALAFAAQGTAKLVWAMRWQEILRVNGISRSVPELVSLLLIGLFFNNFLPTSMGGDVARGYMSAGSTDKLSTAYGVVVAERLIGFVSLGAIAIPALIWAWLETPYVSIELFTIGLSGCVLMLTAGAAVLWTNRWVGRLSRLVSAWPRAGRLFDALVDAVQFMRRPGYRIMRVVCLSILVQVIGVLFFLFSARAVLIDAPVLLFFFIVPIAIVSSMVPLSLNGLGLREGALVGLMQTVGVTASMAAAFAVLARMIDFVFALIGGLLFLLRTLSNRRGEDHHLVRTGSLRNDGP